MEQEEGLHTFPASAATVQDRQNARNRRILRGKEIQQGSQAQDLIVATVIGHRCYK
jgi:hypothetical protein